MSDMKVGGRTAPLNLQQLEGQIQQPTKTESKEPVAAPEERDQLGAAPAQDPSVRNLQQQTGLNTGTDDGQALRGLTGTQRNELGAIAGSLDFSNPAAISDRWGEFIAGVNTGGVPMDINALIQWVLKESYLETNKDLQFYADKVRYFNDVKEAIRDHLTDVREQFAEVSKNNPGAQDSDDLGLSIDKMDVPGYYGGAPGEEGVALEKTGTKTGSTKKDIENYIEELEQKLSSVGDDAQLANIDLQNKLQQQQQTLQTISNVSKMLHDTAMAIVRKIG
jgi:hypothetical protein